MKDYDEILFGGPCAIFYVEFSLAPGTTVAGKLEAPITELVLCYFSVTETTTAKQKRFSDETLAAFESLPESEPRPKSLAYGWSVQDSVETFREGKKEEKVWAAIVGWASEEDFRKARDGGLIKKILPSVDGSDLDVETWRLKGKLM
jgi:hypothetical protein